MKKASKLAVGELLEIVAMKGITAPGAATEPAGAASKSQPSSSGSRPSSPASATTEGAPVAAGCHAAAAAVKATGTPDVDEALSHDVAPSEEGDM